MTKSGHIPKTKTEWWTEKIRKNQERDLQEHTLLKQQGWRVLVVWECQLVPKKREQTLLALEGVLSGQILEFYRKTQSYIRETNELPQVAEPELPYNSPRNTME